MDAIVLKALVKDPDYRYQSADEMRADIEACLDGQPVAATAAMGSVGYGGYGDDQPTTALRSADAGATSMLPPMNPDDGGYGYDDRPDRRRQKKSNTSTILLVVAGVLVLVGAILIGKWVFAGDNAADTTRVRARTSWTETQADAKKLADQHRPGAGASREQGLRRPAQGQHLLAGPGRRHQGREEAARSIWWCRRGRRRSRFRTSSARACDEAKAIARRRRLRASRSRRRTRSPRRTRTPSWSRTRRSARRWRRDPRSPSPSPSRRSSPPSRTS